MFLIKRQVADKRGKRDRLYLIFRAPQSAKWRDSLSATRFAIGLLEAASVYPGNTKGGSITVPLTSCLTGLESVVRQLTIFVFICKTDLSKPVKREVNGTVIPLVFPSLSVQKLELQ